jgi:hypothetical protein
MASPVKLRGLQRSMMSGRMRVFVVRVVMEFPF